MKRELRQKRKLLTNLKLKLVSLVEITTRTNNWAQSASHGIKVYFKREKKLRSCMRGSTHTGQLHHPTWDLRLARSENPETGP